MSDRGHLARQRAFYARRDHDHLRVRDDDLYASKLAHRLATQLGIGPEHRVLELGAGFGRFTFPLLEHCASIVALDVSQRLLDELAATRDARGIPEDRCEIRCADVEERPDQLNEEVDFVVGFFLLHHLADYGRAFQRVRPLLAPGGRMGFVEPNRRNPLFVAQIVACPDMTWREEKGMFLLSEKKVVRAFRTAGLEPRPTHCFGFFPPPLLNRFESARRLEARLESLSVLRAFLPFLLLSAEDPRASTSPA